MSHFYKVRFSISRALRKHLCLEKTIVIVENIFLITNSDKLLNINYLHFLFQLKTYMHTSKHR